METPVTNRLLRELHPTRWCQSSKTRGRYTWVCYQHPNHLGPHKGGNSDNDPIYLTWFDVVQGG